MPTGYTSEIYDGKDVSFEDFVLRCARAMGACIYQRDNPWDEPPKLQAGISDYHQKELKEAKERLARLQHMSNDDIDEACKTEHASRIKEMIERHLRSVELRKRYEAMLSKIKAWEPPSKDHEGFKDFMVEQLTSSIEFDCEPAYPEIDSRVSNEEWHASQIRKTLRDIDYHTQEEQKEFDRMEARNRWIALLYKSLEMVPPAERIEV